MEYILVPSMPGTELENSVTVLGREPWATSLHAVPVRESPTTTSRKGVSGSYGGSLSIKRPIVTMSEFDGEEFEERMSW
jgi:hypothetical protein